MSLLFERNEYSWMRWRRGVLVSSFSPSSDILILSWYHWRHRGASGLRSVPVIEPDQDDSHVVAAILAIPPTSFIHNDCLEETLQLTFPQSSCNKCPIIPRKWCWARACLWKEIFYVAWFLTNFLTCICSQSLISQSSTLHYLSQHPKPKKKYFEKTRRGWCPRTG